MDKEIRGLRALIGEEDWPDLVATGHSTIPNDFMDFWSRFLPENYFFAYIAVCEGVVRQLNIQQLIATMQLKGIFPDKVIEPEIKEIFEKNEITLPTSTADMLPFFENLKLIEKVANNSKYDICYPIPLPDEIFKWLPEEDIEYINMMKEAVRECHD